MMKYFIPLKSFLANNFPNKIIKSYIKFNYSYLMDTPVENKKDDKEFIDPITGEKISKSSVTPETTKESNLLRRLMLI